MPPTAAPPRAGAPGQVPDSGARRVPAPVRERRPALLALGLVLVLGGALGSALVVHRSGDRVDVLVARHDIEPGERVEAEDLRVARVAADGAAVVPAAAIGNFVGTWATTRVPADTLVNRTMFLAGGAVPADAAVVGVVLGPEQRPSGALRSGDVVRAYLVAEDGGATVTGDPAGTVLLAAARVVDAGAGGASGSDAVSLLVPAQRSAAVVAAAAAGQVAVARVADGTRPDVDLVRE
ncbi:SAF domain-containing protein [Kineococcus sp. SYSU DK005]|uniref:SAF domain-containing protein n=1 Tax=Kineococcus sp. SYSU DK005 TaxID=3383126 RepID=UPI003D7DC56E